MRGRAAHASVQQQRSSILQDLLRPRGPAAPSVGLALMLAHGQPGPASHSSGVST